MEAKCYLAKGSELDLGMTELLTKTRSEGQNSIGAKGTGQNVTVMPNELAQLLHFMNGWD